MHTCLRIAEILDAIFEQVSDSLQNGASRQTASRTLLALGLTCRTMIDPALDRLWETQAGLSQLARTLPTDSWAHFGKSIVTLTRPLGHDDWRRFDSYALRIRNFGFELDGTSNSNAWQPVNYAVLDAFSAHHPGAPLLPRLRRLRLTTSLTKSMQFIELLLTPSLTSVAFDFGLHWRLQEEQVFVAAVLAGAEMRCPDLEEVIVDRIPFERVATSLRALAYMLPQRLYTPSLCGDDILRLAAVPRLRHAEFRICDVLDSLSPARALHLDAFRSLRVLRLHVHSLDVSTALLKLLRTPYLEALGVHAEERPDTSTLSAFLTELLAIASPINFRSLRLFDGTEATAELYTGDLPAWWSDRPAVDARVLEPLLSLANIRVVEINFSLRYQLDDEFIARMAASWPALEHLNIGTLYGWGRPSGVSLAGLREVSTRCPQLRFCGMALNLIDIDLPRTDSLGCNTHVTKLFIADTTATEDACEASTPVLLSLFPNLEVVVSYSVLSSGARGASEDLMMPGEVASQLTSRISAFRRAVHDVQ